MCSGWIASRRSLSFRDRAITPRLNSTTRAPLTGHPAALPQDAQRELAVAAVTLHQREPERQERIDSPGCAGVADVDRTYPDSADELLGDGTRSGVGREEQVRARQRVGEVLPP